jgi:hypothetical protein
MLPACNEAVLNSHSSARPNCGFYERGNNHNFGIAPCAIAFGVDLRAAVMGTQS